jgi:hypothetical protein
MSQQNFHIRIVILNTNNYLQHITRNTRSIVHTASEHDEQFNRTKKTRLEHRLLQTPHAGAPLVFMDIAVTDEESRLSSFQMSSAPPDDLAESRF